MEERFPLSLSLWSALIIWYNFHFQQNVTRVVRDLSAQSKELHVIWDSAWNWPKLVYLQYCIYLLT